MTLFKIILAAAAFAAALGLFLWALISYFNTPYLYESYSSRQCAFIELADGTRLTCDHYDPEQRYIHGWAQ